MGDSFQVIVDVEATLDEAPALAAAVIARLVALEVLEATPSERRGLGGPGYAPGPAYRWAIGGSDDELLSLLHNGCRPIVGRTVFHPYEDGDLETLQCPACGRPAGYDLWRPSIAEWHHATGPALVECPGCGAANPLTDFLLHALGASR